MQSFGNAYSRDYNIGLSNLVSGTFRYFRGGYTTRTHGSIAAGSKVDAIQLETPIEMRVDAGKEGLRNFGRGLANAIVQYYQTYYR